MILTEHQKIQLKNIISGLTSSLESTEHQANCIEAHDFHMNSAVEDTPEEHLLHPETKEILGLDDMWDCNDQGNWDSMADNIRLAVNFLKELQEQNK